MLRKRQSKTCQTGSTYLLTLKTKYGSAKERQFLCTCAGELPTYTMDSVHTAGPVYPFSMTDSKTWGHVGIVCDVDAKYVYIVHGNWHCPAQHRVCAPSGYSNNNKDCVKNYSTCGKWPLKTLTNQGQTIISFTRPAWGNTNGGESSNWGRIDKYACPIDVTYSYAGEILDSATNQFNTSFGNMVIDNEGKSITVTLYDNCDADIKITGTGNMTLTSTFLKDNVPVDSRTFENVPITPNTIGRLYAYDSAATELLSIYSFDQFIESWVADKNEKVVSASKEATDWFSGEHSGGSMIEHDTYVITFDGVTTMTTGEDSRLSSLPAPTRSGYTLKPGKRSRSRPGQSADWPACA